MEAGEKTKKRRKNEKKKTKKEKKKNKNKDKKKREGVKNKEKRKAKRKRKEEASRRSRGARERGKKREEKRKRERRKKKKERMRGAAPHPGSLAGCTRARNYVSRLVCGLGRRQQDGGSEWRGERDREEVGGENWKWENERRVEAGREGAGSREMCTSRFFVWKTEAAKKHLVINELAAAAGVEMEPRDVGRNVRETGIKRKAMGRCWPADAGRGGAGRRKAELCSVKKNAEMVSAGWRRKQRCCLPKKCAPRVFAPEKFALAFFCLPADVFRLNFVLLFWAAGAALPGNTKQKKNGKNLLRWRKIRHIVYIRN